MELTGLHHVTAITARASDNLAFYTKTLGMRLVKKTVNQDDVSAYHLFYAGMRDALRSGGPPPVDLADAVAVMRIIEAAQLSARTASVVSL